MFERPYSGMGHTKCIVWIACAITMANKTTYLEWTLRWTHLLTGFYIQFFCFRRSHLNAVHCQIFIINNFISDCHFRSGQTTQRFAGTIWKWKVQKQCSVAHALEILINCHREWVPSEKQRLTTMAASLFRVVYHCETMARHKRTLNYLFQLLYDVSN